MCGQFHTHVFVCLPVCILLVTVLELLLLIGLPVLALDSWQSSENNMKSNSLFGSVLHIQGSHFPQVTKFQAKPQNVLLATAFPHFGGILQNSPKIVTQVIAFWHFAERLSILAVLMAYDAIPIASMDVKISIILQSCLSLLQHRLLIENLAVYLTCFYN